MRRFYGHNNKNNTIKEHSGLHFQASLIKDNLDLVNNVLNVSGLQTHGFRL